MIENILPDLYRMEIPLPGNPLRAVNSYVIKTADHSLIIDTGMNRTECLEAMRVSLTKLNVNLKKTDFFITHSHSDHFGLISSLARDGSTVYFNRPDAEHLSCSARWGRHVDFAAMNGFPEGERHEILRKHPGYKYGTETLPTFTVLNDNDTLRIAGYRFICVQTPGQIG